MLDEIIDVHAHWSDSAALQAAAKHRLARGDEDEKRLTSAVCVNPVRSFPIAFTRAVVWDSYRPERCLQQA
jgi:hypothetical protein